MPYAVILISGTVSTLPGAEPLITGYARSMPGDHYLLPVVDDIALWDQLCREQLCDYEAVQVTEQWSDGYWMLPTRPIPIPEYGGA